MAEHDSGARRALPGEGTGMSGVVELAEQLAVVRKRELALLGSIKWAINSGRLPDDLREGLREAVREHRSAGGAA